MQQTIRVSGPAELAAIVPYQLGFQPRRSVVVMCLHGKRVGMVARLDAVPMPHASQAAANLVSLLQRQRPDSVAVIGYEQEPGESQAVSDALAAALGLTSMHLTERIVVRGGRWYCAQDDGCPPEGEAMPDAGEVPAVAHFVVAGRAVLADRSDLEAAVRPGGQAGGPVSSAARRVAAQLGVRASDRGSREVGARAAGVTVVPLPATARPEVFAAWGRLLSGRLDPTVGPDIPVDDLALLLGGLRDVLVRDALVAWVCADDQLARLLPGDVRAQVDTHLGPSRARAQSPEGGHWLESDEAREVLARLQALCRLAPPEEAAPVLTVTAALTWERGNGAMAASTLEQALDLEPDHRLAQLLDLMVVHGVRRRDLEQDEETGADADGGAGAGATDHDDDADGDEPIEQPWSA